MSTSDLRYNSIMARIPLALIFLALVFCLACQKDSAPAAPAETANASPQGGGGGGTTVIAPEVGGMAPVTSTSLDNAAGGGVSSSMMRKAKGIASEGVGSVNSAQKHGEAV